MALARRHRGAETEGHVHAFCSETNKQAAQARLFLFLVCFFFSFALAAGGVALSTSPFLSPQLAPCRLNACLYPPPSSPTKEFPSRLRCAFSAPSTASRKALGESAKRTETAPCFFRLQLGRCTDEKGSSRRKALNPKTAAASIASPSSRQRRRSLQVCIVGRPNVGKSALFNRLVAGNPGDSSSVADGEDGVKGFTAIVHGEAGTTRDRLYGRALWRGRLFEVVDTGGVVLDDEADSPFADELKDQVTIALQQAACAVLVVDGRAGVQSGDEFMAEMLRLSGIPSIVCVNKCEHPQRGFAEAQAFWRLGLGEPLPCSAITGSGVGELIDKCLPFLADLDETDASASHLRLRVGGEEKPFASVALIGRPNAGKSSLLNRLLNSNRSIVSASPGTTRDAVDDYIKLGDKTYHLVDTAGIRRLAFNRAASKAEFYMLKRAEAAIARSDACVLVVDGAAGLTHQDVNLAKKIEAQGKCVVVVVNKCDQGPSAEEFRHKDAVEYVRQVLHPLPWAQVLFMSALSGRGVEKLWPALEAAIQQFRRRLTTGLLNFVVRDTVAVYPPPPTAEGKRGKIYVTQQVSTSPPTIVVFCNKAHYFTDVYRRYIDFAVRRAFAFLHTPIRWLYREKRKRNMDAALTVRAADS